MSNAQKLAESIPAEYRKEIVEMNMIQEAKAQSTDPFMIHLSVIYRNYIDGTFSLDCNLCAGRCLDVWKVMLPHLVELEKNSNTLDKV